MEPEKSFETGGNRGEGKLCVLLDKGREGPDSFDESTT